VTGIARTSGADAVADALVNELVDRLQAGGANIDEFIAAHPDHAEVLRGVLPAARLMADLAGSVPGDSAVVDVAGERLGELGDFRLIREVGRGGMGVVYEAEQLSLRRRVALKVLPLAATMDPRQLQRFRHEAQAAALLHHPHIVPVHGVGCERGVHYYAMQLISGRSLANVIDELRGGDEGGRLRDEVKAETGGFPASLIPDPSSLPTAPVAAQNTRTSRPGRAHYRRAAELVAEAADALEYAHSTGVVHRDIKPANLLLDESGHLWVADFGLAKLDTAAGVTISGDVLGTLRYMSPEQALARHGLVDHRTDIYSLGATLYELLTLCPAVTGRDKQEVLRQIAFEETVAPRRLDRSIPAELETVALKALAKVPAERYPTARELADDLRRYLENRPVTARRPTWPQRLRKWSQRHRGVVATAVIAVAVVVVTVVAALAVGLVQVNREKDRTRAALNAEGRRRKQARDALDATTSLMLEDLLARQQTLTDEHKRYLSRALQAYEEFAAETAGDESTRYGAARALANVGRIRFRLDPSPAAADLQRQAVARFEQLATDFPEEPLYRRDVTVGRRELGRTLYRINQRDAARLALAAAVADGERLVADYPSVPGYRGDLALNDFHLGNFGARTPAEAETTFRKAIALLLPLVAEFPGVQDYREALGRSEQALSMTLASMGAPSQGEVLSAARKSIEIFKQLVAESAGNPRYRLALAQCQMNLANRLRTAVPASEIEQAYREALALFRDLAAEYPAVPQHRLDLANALNNLGVYLKDAGRESDAESYFRDAIAAAKRLVEDHGQIPEYRSIQGTALFNLGVLCLQTGRSATAEECLNESLAIRTQLVAASDNHANRNSLALTLVKLAVVRHAKRQFDDGRDFLQRAVPHHQAALKVSSNNSIYRAAYCENRCVLFEILSDLGDGAAASQAFEELATAAGDVANGYYHAACYLARCAAAAANDHGRSESGRGQSMDEYSRRAIERLRSAARAGFKDLRALETNDDFSALRTRQDLQEFLAEIKARTKD
jgi:serine/threonine protein kinase